ITGPVEHTRLRLLVDSGMLQPHHKVRKEEQTAWSQAGAVRGLFTPTATVPVTTVSPPVPVARAAPVGPAGNDESPFAAGSAPASGAPPAATRGRIGGPRGRRGGRRGRGEPLRVRAATDAARPGGLADRGNQTHRDAETGSGHHNTAACGVK